PVHGRPIRNAGVMNLVGGGTIYVGNNATITNSGTIDFQADNQIYMNGTIGTTSITNSGTIKKSAGSSGSTFNVPHIAQSGSQLLAQASIFYLGPITSTGGTFDVSAGATLDFYYSDTRTFDAASTISGAGTVQWNGGTNTVNGTYAISGTTITSGGTATLNSITNTGSIS